MAQFPVKYAQTPPPAAGPVVRAHLDVDTGAEWAGRGLMRAGQALSEFGQKLQDAEDVMAVSTLERKSAEIRNAAFQAMQETQDTDAQLKIWEKARTEIGGLPSGQRKRVADHFTVRLNEMMPVADAHAADVMRRTKINRAKDDYDINSAALLEAGDVAGYAKLQYMAKGVGLITPERAEANVKDAPVASKLTIAGKMLLAKDVAQIQAGIAELAKMDTAGMPAEVLERHSKLLTMGEAAIVRLQDQNYKEAYKPLTDLREQPDLSPVEVYAATEAYRQGIEAQAKRGELSEHHRAELSNASMILDRAVAMEARREEKVVNYPLLNSRWDRARRMIETGTPDPTLATDVEQDYIAGEYGQGKTANANYVSLKKYLEGRTFVRELAVTDFIMDKYKTDHKDDPDLALDLFHLDQTRRHYAVDHPGDLEGIVRFMAIKAASGQTKKAEKPAFTEAHIQQALGTLAAGGPAAAKWEDQPAAGKLPPMFAGQQAINFMLRELGPDWWKIAPKAVDIIRTKWPEVRAELYRNPFPDLTAEDVRPPTPKPTEYPDAVWSAKYKMWTIRSPTGALMGVK